MSSLVSIIFVVVVFYVVISRSLKKNAALQGKVPGKGAAASKAKSGRPQGFTNYKPHKDITSVTRDMGDSKNSSVLRDDRANDWLAKQLREEHKAFKLTSEMFDLKIEHASHCDARLMAQFHHKYCNASGIDLANGSTIRK